MRPVECKGSGGMQAGSWGSSTGIVTSAGRIGGSTFGVSSITLVTSGDAHTSATVPVIIMTASNRTTIRTSTLSI